MKCAGAYKKEKTIYLNPMSRTTTGLWIGTSPRIILDESAPAAVKGKHVREVLIHSQDGLPHPTDWDAFLKPFLKAVGFPSWNKFAKGAITCSIELEGDRLKFIPYRNSGPKEHYAFRPIKDGEMTVSFAASDEELGLILEKAFDACE